LKHINQLFVLSWQLLVIPPPQGWSFPWFTLRRAAFVWYKADPQAQNHAANRTAAAAAAAAAGGTVVYAACFASQTSSHDMDAVFKAMGLLWSHGSYYRCGGALSIVRSVWVRLCQAARFEA
jgi:protein-S-isoprenylcysteine O-methyltransferase Ste14